MNIGIAVVRYATNEGTGGYVAQLLPGIAHHHDVTLYAAEITAPVPDGVTVVRVPAVMWRAYSAIFSFPVAFRAVRRRHDLVHAQGWVASSADVVTAHYVLAAWREIARRAGVRSPVGEEWFGGFVERSEAALYRKRCRAVIAPSLGVKNDLGYYYGRTENVHLVRHGFRETSTVPQRQQSRRRFGLASDPLVAVWVGDARKGLATAVAAVASVPEVHLLVASASSARPYLAQAQASGCASRVHWAGYVEDPWTVYAAGDVFLYPTLYDPFGLVVAEAMASGLPPIVTRVAGVAELIEHCKSGWLLETPTVEESASALRTLIADAALRRRLGEGAREVARKRTWDQVARETLKVYDATHEGARGR